MPGKRNRTKRLDEIRDKLIFSYRRELIIIAEILEHFIFAKNKFEKEYGEDIFDWPPLSEIRNQIINLKKRRKYFSEQGWVATPNENAKKKLNSIEAEVLSVIFNDLKNMQEKTFLDQWDDAGQPIYGDRIIDEESARKQLSEYCRKIANKFG